jgi:hypothetical protein
MPDDPDDQTESAALIATAADGSAVAQLAPAGIVPSDHAETAAAPTAAELLLDIGGSAAALAQIGLVGARARLARLVPRARGNEVLGSVTTGLETAVTAGKEVTRMAGTVIKETAQNPEAQELVFRGAAAAAREVGLMMAGSVGGLIVDRISERIGDKLLRGRTAESGDRQPSVQPGAGHDETGERDRLGIAMPNDV